ncbi:MAG TPA: phosphate ABC transporter ATP-binding protein PstB [Stellaceae bacterium]|nr:phosphate ABC transporter ATP-binding protein PstB [Stellaceae bacterium]
MVPQEEVRLSVERLSAYYGQARAVNNVSLAIRARMSTAIIGPSGCGKSTLLRSLNRMHEVVRGARVEGKVLLDGKDLYAPSMDAVKVRRRIGMVFQRANPFPSRSIFENVAVGPRLDGMRDRKALEQSVERSLRMAALWDEVKDQLHQPATRLSGGQQQRLCIARAIAIEPEVLLMDEPCSALDPISTARIEALIEELKKTYTILIVTHNLQQAARASDFTAFMYLGELVEFDTTVRIFERPTQKMTEDYITGRYG